jgi:hypothetical protein
MTQVDMRAQHTSSHALILHKLCQSLSSAARGLTCAAFARQLQHRCGVALGFAAFIREACFNGNKQRSTLTASVFEPF